MILINIGRYSEKDRRLRALSPEWVTLQARDRPVAIRREADSISKKLNKKTNDTALRKAESIRLAIPHKT